MVGVADGQRLTDSHRPIADLRTVRLPALDGIRAISISLVILFHLTASALKPSTFGGFGVEIFFVLSGFLITRLLSGEGILPPQF